MNTTYNIPKSDDSLSVIDAKLEVLGMARTNVELNDTVDLMNSSDYKDRFKAEYYQLKIRLAKLTAMLVQYKSHQLSFTPSCPYDVLESQRQAMTQYLSILEQRASIENIDLG